MVASSMKSPFFTVLLALTSCLVVEEVSSQFSRADYGSESSPIWFEGEGTYYGYTDGGNCAMRELPSEYTSLPAVAINDAQYAGSASCGACVEYTGNGQGSGGDPIVGTHIAYIHDRCPECSHGSLDLSQDGDGRWKIRFRFVPCPFEDHLSFLFEGSNDFYWKLQPRGLKYPVDTVTVNGLSSYRTQDNFFIVQNGDGHILPAEILVTDVMGRSLLATINSYASDVDLQPMSVSFTSGGTPTTTMSPTPSPTPSSSASAQEPPKSCVADWRACSSNTGASPCCNKSFECRYNDSSAQTRCERVVPQCIRSGYRCSWYSGKVMDVPCCNGLSCVHPGYGSLSYCI